MKFLMGKKLFKKSFGPPLNLAFPYTLNYLSASPSKNQRQNPFKIRG